MELRILSLQTTPSHFAADVYQDGVRVHCGKGYHAHEDALSEAQAFIAKTYTRKPDPIVLTKETQITEGECDVMMQTSNGQTVIIPGDVIPLFLKKLFALHLFDIHENYHGIHG